MWHHLIIFYFLCWLGSSLIDLHRWHHLIDWEDHINCPPSVPNNFSKLWVLCLNFEPSEMGVSLNYALFMGFYDLIVELNALLLSSFLVNNCKIHHKLRLFVSDRRCLLRRLWALSSGKRADVLRLLLAWIFLRILIWDWTSSFLILDLFKPFN